MPSSWTLPVLIALTLALAAAGPAAADDKAKGKDNPKATTEKAKPAVSADRQRARDRCQAEARRRDYEVLGTGDVRGDRERLTLDMRLRRGDRRYEGRCSYDVARREAALSVRQGGGGSSGGSGGGGGYASNDQVRDKCVQEVTGNARTQLVGTGKIEQRGNGVSAMPMVLNVEGQERRVTCYFDNRTRAANIR